MSRPIPLLSAFQRGLFARTRKSLDLAREILILATFTLIISLIVAWICSAIRSALLTVERTRVDELAENGDATAMTLRRLLDNPFRTLAPINFIYTASVVGMALGLTWHALETSAEPFPRLSEILIVLVIFFIGKVVFDFAATARALALVRFATPLLVGLVALSRPFLDLSAWLTRLAKGSRPRTRSTEKVSSDDIQIIMAEGEEPRKLESIDADEREMIAGIIEMGQRYASEIMIPRPDIIALEVNTPLNAALDVAIQHGHSRIPVYDENIDHIIGILHVKDLLPPLRQAREAPLLRDLLRPVHYVPDTAKADDLLRDLLRDRVHMAIVVDEYGGTAGALTIEDVIEEIVGEIRDEYDSAEEAPFTRVSEVEAVFNASVPISEVNEVLDADLPTEESDTLGGLIYTNLGRLSKVGDRIAINGVELTVEAVHGRRIKQVRGVKLSPQTSMVASNGKEE